MSVQLNVFYGPWRVKVLAVQPHPPQRFTVRGSTNADGDYPVHPGQSFELRIDGPRWVVGIQQFSYPLTPVGTDPTPESWQDSDGLKRQMKVVRPGPGLTVTLDTHRHQLGYDTGITLECVCDDPNINPPVPANPYDFGYKAQ